MCHGHVLWSLGVFGCEIEMEHHFVEPIKQAHGSFRLWLHAVRCSNLVTQRMMLALFRSVTGVVPAERVVSTIWLSQSIGAKLQKVLKKKVCCLHQH